MLSVLFFYFLRMKDWWKLVIVGFCVVFTKYVGLILLAVLWVDWWIGRRKNIRKYLLVTLMILVAMILYLHINFVVSGNPLMFSVYQKEHWFNGYDWFYRNIAMVVSRSINSDSHFNVTVWIPFLVSILITMGSIVVGIYKKIKLTYLAYLFIYLSATWPISGARYLMALFPVYFVIAMVIKNNKLIWISLSVLLFILQCVFSLWFMEYRSVF